MKRVEAPAGVPGAGSVVEVHQNPGESLRAALNRTVQQNTTTPPLPSDPIFRPHHYARFVIEPLTFVNANKLPYNIGNVIKYVCRYDAKNGLEDLKKARRYIDIQIECMERAARIEAGEDAATVWKEVL